MSEKLKKVEKTQRLMPMCERKVAKIDSLLKFIEEHGGRVKRSTARFHLELKAGFNKDVADYLINGLIELGDLTSEINTGTEFIRIVKTTEVSDEKSKEKMVARE